MTLEEQDQLIAMYNELTEHADRQAESIERGIAAIRAANEMLRALREGK
jgi:hypothetical protein